MLPQNNFQRKIERAQRRVARAGPPLFALCSLVLLVSAIFEIVTGALVEGGISGLMAAGLALLAWYGWKSLRNDDDDHYDDVIYHGVPVEAPEPLVENRTDKAYIDCWAGGRT